MADWVVLGADVMFDARKKKGLSYEGAARLLHISSKTYERREKAGRWPAHDVEQLASVLGLRIEHSEPRTIILTPAGQEEIPAVLAEIRDLLRQLEERLGPEGPQSADGEPQ